VDNITPRGRYYEASVPDTLDLSERARLAVHALTEALNPDSGYGPYGHTFFKVQPPYMTESMYAPNMDAGKANWGKIMEALVLLRSVCGSDLNLQIESRSLQGMIGYVDTVGCPYQCSRVLMTLMELHRQHATPELRELIQRLASRLHNHVQHTGNLAAYQDPEPKLQDSRSGINNYEVQTHQHSGPIWALCQWHDLAGNSRDLELAGKLSRFVSQPRFWEPEVEPKFFTGADRGHFKGHIHSYVGALIGMLEYADRANDAWLREFVRNGYEYVRNVGIARIGALGETCTIGDMTVLAAELSRMGIGDYWDHVDQYVRNHLSEMQLVDQDLVARCVSVMPRADELPEGPRTPTSSRPVGIASWARTRPGGWSSGTWARSSPMVAIPPRSPGTTGPTRSAARATAPRGCTMRGTAFWITMARSPGSTSCSTVPHLGWISTVISRTKARW
jgi:hypothetical protein